MENTRKVLFEDNTPQWYIAQGDQWIGPLTAAEVYEKVVSQEISWAHFVWKPGQSDWKRICDVKVFQSAVPRLPGKDTKQEVKQAAAAAKAIFKKTGGSRESRKMRASDRNWFLYYNDSQFGPFSFEEVARFLAVGRIHGRVHAWSEGMEGWERLENLQPFHEAVADSKKARAVTKKSSAGPTEQRKAPRIPLVAKIILANSQDESVNVAMCRDISMGGMQVLMDRVPGKIGSKIRLNVSGGIAPFVAEGVIVRILEDERGFSFRFERLSEDARRAIESYITAAS
jgi:hypothetical protein